MTGPVGAGYYPEMETHTQRVYPIKASLTCLICWRVLFTRALPISMAVLLTACAGQSVRDEATEATELPELNLNLPSKDCACEAQQEAFTFLEKGVDALSEAAYLESLRYFQSYQRIENTPQANLESAIAIAYLSTLPKSPIYDRAEAYKAYSALRGQLDSGISIHEPVRIMQNAMESFIEMYDQVEQLKRGNASLRAELEKREEAITRLRDLTLGREPESAAQREN